MEVGLEVSLMRIHRKEKPQISSQMVRLSAQREQLTEEGRETRRSLNENREKYWGESKSL